MLVITAALLMVAISWRKWPEVLVDFGLQLYIPWQLSTGNVLYRDIAYLPGGPFSQYLNAGLFKLFGTSMMTLAIANAALTSTLLFATYRWFRKASDTLTATLIVLGIILAFAFSQPFEMGNYNFITPYSHEAFHGFVLGILTIGFLSNWVLTGKRGSLVCAALCFGTVFLTKPEMFLAVTCAIMAGFVFSRSKPLFVQSLVIFAGVGVLPSLGFLCYFLQFDSLQSSLKSVSWAWIPLFTSDVSDNPFYRWCLGLDAPLRNVKLMLLHFAVFTGIVVVLLLRFRRSHATSRARLITILLIAIIAVGTVLFDWTDSGRALPLITLGGLTLIFWQRKWFFSHPSKALFPVLWGIFSLVLLAKMGFHSRIWHYGFLLAMPAFVWAIYLLVHLLPHRFIHDSVNQLWFRRSILFLLLIAFTRLAAQSAAIYAKRDFAIGTGGDRIVTWNEKTSVSAEVAEALEWIETNVSEKETLAVLPEGAMLNYLSRRSNPTPYLVLMAEVEVYGMQNMTIAYQKNPPDFIVLMHRETAEYGWNYFGKDKVYGLDLMNWINENYKPVHRIGYEPLRNGLFGIKMLKRIPPVQPGH
ncbi:MAG: hypothetical protein H0X66_00495 [Verrucomicrobia bacterium]|nr:hypothetical protein [Verrucomicrobiota bacterium]